MSDQSRRSIWDFLFGGLKARTSMRAPSLVTRRQRLNNLKHGAKDMKSRLNEYKESVFKTKKFEITGVEPNTVAAIQAEIDSFYNEIHALLEEVETVQQVEFNLTQSFEDLENAIKELEKHHPEFSQDFEKIVRALADVEQKAHQRFKQAQKQALDELKDKDRRREFSLKPTIILLKQLKRQAKETKRDYPHMKQLEHEVHALDHAKGKPDEVKKQVATLINHINSNNKELEEEINDLYNVEHIVFILENRFSQEQGKELMEAIAKFDKEGMGELYVQKIKNHYLELQQKIINEERNVFYRAEVIQKAA
jgi:chromosome segregation ATPase